MFEPSEVGMHMPTCDNHPEPGRGATARKQQTLERCVSYCDPHQFVEVRGFPGGIFFPVRYGPWVRQGPTVVGTPPSVKKLTFWPGNYIWSFQAGSGLIWELSGL